MPPAPWTSEHIQTIVRLVKEGLAKEQTSTNASAEEPQDEDF
jgi:hypothetical protein